MREYYKHQLWILLAACAVLLTSLQATSFWDEDEGFFAGTAAEMHAADEWIVPTFNGELFGHKPPWMYWMMMIGFHLFGTTEFAARFFSAVCGIAGCCLTYHLGRRVFNAQVGLWAGLILATSLMYNVVSRAATPDVYLTFFSALALYVFAVSGPFRADTSLSNRPAAGQRHPLLPVRWSSYVAMYASMGIAALVKGPIGFLFPMAVIGFFLLCTTPRRSVASDATRWVRLLEACRPFGPVNFLRTVWQMRILTAIAVILLVAGPWYLAVGWKTEGAFLQEFFGVHHYQRFATSMEDHSGPIYYYLLSVLVGMFPWSIFALPASLLVVRHLRQAGPARLGLGLFACWAGVYLTIFSLASTKLPNYVVPAYPALAVLAAYFYQTWISQPETVHRWWPRLAYGILLVLGLAAVVGLPVAGGWRLDGQTLLDQFRLAPSVQADLVSIGLVGIPVTLGAIWAWVLAERQRTEAAVRVTAITATLLMLGLWNHAAPRVAGYQVTPKVAQAIVKQSSDGQANIASFHFFRPSLVYYTANPIGRVRSVEAAEQFLSLPGTRILVTNDRWLTKSEGALPGNAEVIGRFSRFPESGNVILLRQVNEPQTVLATPAQPTRR